ncbi:MULTISPECIES: transposase [Sphingobacterium]|uniref:Transposase n=1 Tax=Sphingobacterium populi TaxID=1812824 RepID=A0ABW5U8Y0_9SPHI|nr:transposase [Sphingobacterium sp. CFCC 11742]
MKKSKFSEHQIINILKEYESGKSTKDICREHGISAPTFYQWKHKYGGMDVQHLKEFRRCRKKIHD